VENDKILPISKYSSDIDIYSIENIGENNEKIVFNCRETMNFLRDNGFRRIRSSHDAESDYQFIRMDDGVISRCPTWEIRNFVLEYIETNCKSAKVLEFFSSKISTLLADKQLEQLALIDDDFNHFERCVQHTPYNNGMVEITSESITAGKPFGIVWKEHILARNFKRVPIISKLEKIGDYWDIDFTPEGRKCEFLIFLSNISNNIYTWEDNGRECTQDEIKNWNCHLVNKITTLGYLMSDWKNSNEKKVVVIQDHAMSEVGKSKGGSGKSLIGAAVSKIKKQTFIDGKEVDPKFIFNNVNRETRSIFIDDVRVNFDFERLYNMINGTMSINKKNRDPLEIGFEESPKIFIATNHAIRGGGDRSTSRRVLYMEASAWYHEGFELFDEFGHTFFDDWDETQWNLFDNLMAECVMYYFRCIDLKWGKSGGGGINPPMDTINLRTLRQDMTEGLLQWADEYFDPSGDKLNERVAKKDIWDAFALYVGRNGEGSGVTQTRIKDKLVCYCKFKGYDMNVNRTNEAGMTYNEFKRKYPNDFFEGKRDVTNGKEYIQIYSPDKEKQLKPF
jgi:gluconate kinase